MKTYLFPFLLLFVAVFTFAGCDDDEDSVDEIINIEDTPQEIKDYLAIHFPGDSTVRVVRDTDDRPITYEVILQSGVQLDFSEDYRVTEIESATALPDSVIPEPIRDYVSTNYPDRSIIKWELENGEQTVKLDDNLELVFDESGTFLRIDN